MDNFTIPENLYKELKELDTLTVVETFLSLAGINEQYQESLPEPFLISLTKVKEIDPDFTLPTSLSSMIEYNIKSKTFVNKAPLEKGLELSVQEFKEQWNLTSKKFKTYFLEISDINVQDGEVYDGFQIDFTSEVSLIGSINKANQTVNNIIIIGAASSEDHFIDFLITVGQAISTIRPDYSVEERNQVLVDLGLYRKDINPDDFNNSKTIDGIKYNLYVSKITGFVFGIEANKDNKSQ